MTKRPVYTDEEVNEFIDYAQEVGIGPAMRKLGYPLSYHTARKWFDVKGAAVPDLDALMKLATDYKTFYGDSEKKAAVQTLMDRIIEKLKQDDLDADGINKLANALNKAIQTFNLIEGKSTSITESHQKDGSDLAVIDMLNAAKAKTELATKDRTLSKNN